MCYFVFLFRMLNRGRNNFVQLQRNGKCFLSQALIIIKLLCLICQVNYEKNTAGRNKFIKESRQLQAVKREFIYRQQKLGALCFRIESCRK